MENNITNVNTGINWLEKLLELSKRYKFFDWVETFLVIFVLGMMILAFTSPGKVINYFNKVVKEQHSELLEKRQENNAELQKIADRLLYITGADRVEILELHNSVSNLSGLPFLKASASVEALSNDTAPIAGQYNEVQLSLVPFSTYLYNTNYYIGTPENMKQYDKALSYRLLSNDVSYFLAGTIPGREKSIGFLFVTFTGDNRPIDEGELIREAQKTAVQAGVLLELRK